MSHCTRCQVDAALASLRAEQAEHIKTHALILLAICVKCRVADVILKCLLIQQPKWGHDCLTDKEPT